MNNIIYFPTTEGILRKSRNERVEVLKNIGTEFSVRMAWEIQINEAEERLLKEMEELDTCDFAGRIDLLEELISLTRKSTYTEEKDHLLRILDILNNERETCLQTLSS